MSKKIVENIGTKALEDTALVLAAQKDRRAFSQLYEKYYQQIFLFVYKRMESEPS
tara:strand:+ start:8545 stop:8709 length:165 start_codon:yes stop_codon:yes gene_type:complete